MTKFLGKRFHKAHSEVHTRQRQFRFVDVCCCKTLGEFVRGFAYYPLTPLAWLSL